jgi:hypothetical protein
MEKAFKIGTFFKSFSELDNAIKYWAIEELHPITIYGSHKLAGEPENIMNLFIYKDITYRCIHSGKLRSRKVNIFIL